MFHRGEGGYSSTLNNQLGIHLSDAKIIDSSCLEQSVTEIIQIFFSGNNFRINFNSGKFAEILQVYCINMFCCKTKETATIPCRN